MNTFYAIDPYEHSGYASRCEACIKFITVIYEISPPVTATDKTHATDP